MWGLGASALNFTELHLHPKLMGGLTELGFQQCTPVQEKCIPYVLQGCDISALAQTGTGKTGAFLVPLMDRVLHSLDPAPPDDAQELYRRRGFQSWKGSHFVLVLVPTRELALQVHKVAEDLGAATQLQSAVVYGGVDFEQQKKQVPEAQFIIATPGRLIDLYKEHIVDLNAVRAVVFDEADQMFDLGFRDDMRYILRRVPRKRQLLMLGATARFDALHTAYEFHSDPIEIDLSQDAIKAENVNDSLFHVGQDDKARYLLSILKKEQPEQVIVFSNFKSQVEWIARLLMCNGLGAVGISSLLSQPQRQKVMQQFRDFKKNILVATDVAARGLDVKGLDLVVNFDLPMNPANYVHRIGRTGRAGKTGVAYSLASERDVESLTRIEDYIQKKLEVGWLEDADLLAPEAVERPRSLKAPVRRGASSSGSGASRREGARRDGARRDGARRDGDGRRRFDEGRDAARRGRREDVRPRRDESRRDAADRDEARRDSSTRRRRRSAERSYGSSAERSHTRRSEASYASGGTRRRGSTSSARRALRSSAGSKDFQTRGSQQRANQQRSNQHRATQQQRRLSAAHRTSKPMPQKGFTAKVKNFFKKIWS